MLAAVVQVAAPALVPPLRPSVMLDWPLVTSEVRMFSMEAAVRAQMLKARIKAVEVRVPVVLNTLAGKVARLVQPSQASPKNVAEVKLIAGKDVRLEQLAQALLKSVPALRLISGNDVRLEQFLQV